MGLKYLTHLRCVNNGFSYLSFSVHVKSFNRHLSTFQLRGTLYCIPRLLPQRYSAFQISRLLSKKDRFMKNTKLDINDIQHDPETRSLIREITEHFQDNFDDPLTETPANSNTENTSETSKVSPHISSKFVPFEKDVEQDAQQDHREASSHFHPQMPSCHQQIDYERGVEGVFDIGQLVEILKLENVQDICVIKVPPELLYAQYLVIVSGRSHRHVSAVAEYIKKLYKKIKDDKEAFIIIQGEGSKDWLALDMGNIVLHIFMPAVRAKYDIETLWSVGEKFDDLCQKPAADLSSKLQSYFELLNEAKPLNSGDS